MDQYFLLKMDKKLSTLNRVGESMIRMARRAATATKACKARALPKFLVTVNPIPTRGADYAHHSTMGLISNKFLKEINC